MSSIKEKSSKFWDNTFSSGIYLLAVVLIIFISIPPFIENETASRVSILILSTVTIGLTILLLPSNANSKRNRWMMVALLGLPWLMGLSFELNIFILSVFALLYSLASWRIIIIIFQEEKVDLRVIVGSVVGYLMVGLSFTFACTLLISFYPDAFRAPDTMESSYSFIYFTFVTMSTLGYGDVVPAIPQSQALSLSIAISGQFYMVIVVAVIVGKYISGRKPV